MSAISQKRTLGTGVENPEFSENIECAENSSYPYTLVWDAFDFTPHVVTGRKGGRGSRKKGGGSVVGKSVA